MGYMSKKLLLAILCCVISVGIGVFVGRKLFLLFRKNGSISLLIQRPKELPLLKYTIPNLVNYPYQTSDIAIEKIISDFPGYTAYQFSFMTLGKKMTGQMNVPKILTTSSQPVIMLVRGYVPPEKYVTGIGSRPAAEVFANHGYVTFAPDFFGYAQSASESADIWEARFQKPMNVVELIKTLQTKPQVTM